MMRKTSPEDLVKAVDLARIKRVAKSDEHVVHRIGPPPPAPLPHPPAPAPAPPPGRASPSPVASPPPPPAQDKLSEQAVEARDGNKGKSDTPAGQLEVEGPLDHPPSEQLPAKFARKYYDTLVLNGNKIPMGSYVELKSTDTEGSRVAKLEALWVDTVVDGGRHYGKFVRFYRPQETAYAFPFRNDPHFVFQSSVKEQLPLSRVERRCTVSFLPDSTAGPASEPYSYVCMYQYDEETETLTTLPK